MNKIKDWLLFFFISHLLITNNCQNVKIAIIGTNDIHGTALPKKMKRLDNGQQYNYGGLPILARLIQIIKKQNQGNYLFLDAGDQFQGGIQSSSLVSSGRIMNDFYNLAQLDGSAIGNHQFDFGPQFLFPFLKSKKVNLAANLRSQNNQQNFLPKQKASKLIQLQSGIKIGTIGLSTIDTPSTTSAFFKGLFPQYKFIQYKQIVIQQSQKLKKNGADIIVLVSHVGNLCQKNTDYGIWTQDSIQNNQCQDGQMTNLIKSLPQNTINAVVQGHTHTTSHIFVNGIPIVGNINGGYYFNVIYLNINLQTKKILQSQIQGPIPVCQKIFSNTKKCQYMNQQNIKNAGQLINWKFHNQNVYPQPRINKIYNQQWIPKMKQYLTQIVVNQIQFAKSSLCQSQIANLFTNLVHNKYQFSDFVVTNMGGFRADWVPGVILQQDLYNMFPFNNYFMSFNISGNQLIQMIKIIQQGQLPLYQFYGIQTIVSKLQDQNKFKYISSKMSNGDQISSQKYYTGIASDFILSGGDDFKNVINKTYIPRNIIKLDQFRSVIRSQLKKLKVIKKGTLIDPKNPRIIIIQ